MSEYYITESPQIGHAKISIVASRFNHVVVDRLLQSCVQHLKSFAIQDKDINIVHVPGAFEIPATVQHVIRNSTYDAVIALGAVIRGETPHFEYICAECTRGLGYIAITNDIPVICGVLTTDNLQQAMDRVGKENNKGIEVAKAAIEMIHVFRTCN